MGLSHPIDDDVRKRLRTGGFVQKDLAKAVGRSQGWLNKYMHGAGHATIDDLVRLAAAVIGVDTPVASEMERRLLRAWRSMPEEHQQDVVLFVENVARARKRARPPLPAAPTAQTLPATSRISRGKRKAVGRKADASRK